MSIIWYLDVWYSGGYCLFFQWCLNKFREGLEFSDCRTPIVDDRLYNLIQILHPQKASRHLVKFLNYIFYYHTLHPDLVERSPVYKWSVIVMFKKSGFRMAKT